MKRDWTPGPILVALCAACVAVGAVWLSYDRWPRGTAHAALWAVLTAACVWRANRNLRAELDAARRLLDAWNSSEARDELALSPPAGTPSVALYDQDASCAGSEFCAHPVAGWRDMGDGVQAAVCDAHLTPAVLVHPVEMTVAETDRLVAQLQALPGEGCRGGDSERIICIDTRCLGHGLPIDGPHHLAAVDPAAGGDPDFDPLGAYWHLGQPCNVCGTPATAWASDRPDPEISDVTFLCDDHYADALAEGAD